MARKTEYLTTITCDFCGANSFTEEDVFVLPFFKPDTSSHSFDRYSGNTTVKLDICRDCTGKPILELIDRARDKGVKIKEY